MKLHPAQFSISLRTRCFARQCSSIAGFPVQPITPSTPRPPAQYPRSSGPVRFPFEIDHKVGESEKIKRGTQSSQAGKETLPPVKLSFPGASAEMDICLALSNPIHIINHVVNWGLGKVCLGLLLGAQIFSLVQTLKLCLVSEHLH